MHPMRQVNCLEPAGEQATVSSNLKSRLFRRLGLSIALLGIALLVLGQAARAQDKVAGMLREKMQLASTRTAAEVKSLSTSRIRFNDTGEVQVYVHWQAGTGTLKAVADAVTKLGAREVNICEPLGVVQAWVKPSLVDSIASLDSVSSVGLPSYGRARTGSVTSEGDTVLKAALARSQFGITGAGVKVGVISDGVDSMAAAKATGDLPASIDVGLNNTGGDEGTAMLEIVYDLAPGAALGFSSGFSDADFINSASFLKNTFGADVIVDDVGFFDEPYFEDGTVAQAAQAAVDGGVVWASAAGNERLQHYQAAFSAAGTTPGGTSGTAHNFNPGGTEDAFMNLGTLYNGESVDIVLQWNDPYSAPASSYKLYLYLSTSSPSPAATSQNLRFYLGGGSNYSGEVLTYTNNTGSSKTPQLVIERISGSANQVEIFGLPESHEYQVPGDSVFGQPAAAGVIAAGAAYWNDTSTVENYSQVGPSTIYHPSLEIREKPEITTVDGVHVTGAGGFGSTFYGTSAAAPHAGAIAALILAKYPGLTPAQVRTAMMAGATDMMASGFDYYSGAGLANAVAAIESLTPNANAVCNWELY